MPSLLGLHPPALLQAVLDSVGVALVVVDKEGRFVFANRAALDMLGERGDLSGVSLLEWRRTRKFHDTSGREIPAEEAPIFRALAGEPVEPQDVLMTLPDGGRKWLHGAGLRFSVLGLAGVFVVITDETEQVELRRAVEQLERMEAFGLLAGGLAHDFNNMLSVVSENLALALSDPRVAETTRQRLLQMSKALRKGTELSKRLLQCSQRQKIKTQIAQINEVVNAALELVSPLLRRGIYLKTELRPGLPVVEADPTLLEQVLVNLIMNALDAMPQGGELTVQTGIARDEAALIGEDKRPRQSIVITVADTGIGIPEDIQARIFEPSFTTKPGKGTGLGLSSAYAIMRQHKGHITAQSARGVGTKFSIYLPVITTSSQG